MRECKYCRRPAKSDECCECRHRIKRREARKMGKLIGQEMMQYLQLRGKMQ